MGPVLVRVADGDPIDRVGALLLTVKVVLGPAPEAVFPARSEAVPEAIDIPSVPSPLMLEMVIVLVEPVPESVTVPSAVPVLLRVILPGPSEMISAFE